MSAGDSATLRLTVLLAIVVGYFILESTIGERYLRYVFSVYPVLIWAGISVLSAHWKDEDEGSRNKIYALMVLLIAVVFLVAKVILCIVWSASPLQETKILLLLLNQMKMTIIRKKLTNL